MTAAEPVPAPLPASLFAGAAPLSPPAGGGGSGDRPAVPGRGGAPARGPVEGAPVYDLGRVDTVEEAVRRGREAHDRQTSGRLAEQLRARIRRRAWAEASPENMAATLAVCAADVRTFINDWVWTYDPRNVDRGLPTHVPFVLRPKQEECLAWLDERLATRTNGLIEKSRDEGATWLLVAYYVHKWLFTPGFKGGVGSRKLTLVDDIGNLDAILPKARSVLRQLPPWMLPAGFDWKAHDNYCRIVNPKTDAAITGEGGDEIGRGGRNTMYGVDEHSKLAHAELVESALSQNTNCIIYIGTPNGPANLFAQKRFGGRTAVFTFSWRENPDKNYSASYVDSDGRLHVISPWYEAQRLEYDEVVVAQEVDIDYNASVKGAVIPAKWVRAAVGLKLPAAGPRTAGLDVAGDGPDLNVYAERHGPVVAFLEAWSGDSTTATAHRARELANGLPTADARAAHPRPDAGAAGVGPVGFLFYDRVNGGEGVTGTFRTTEAPVRFTVVGVNNGQRPTETRYDDEPDVPATARFANLGAELWWRLRRRFQKTYEHVAGIRRHPEDELVSIPDEPTLIAQLSQATYSTTEAGKVRVDKLGGKKGAKSPDHAEAVMYAFAPEELAEVETTESVLVEGERGWDGVEGLVTVEDW